MNKRLSRTTDIQVGSTIYDRFVGTAHSFGDTYWRDEILMMSFVGTCYDNEGHEWRNNITFPLHKLPRIIKALEEEAARLLKKNMEYEAEQDRIAEQEFDHG